jgi:hypothetical protein
MYTKGMIESDMVNSNFYNCLEIYKNLIFKQNFHNSYVFMPFSSTVQHFKICHLKIQFSLRQSNR